MYMRLRTDKQKKWSGKRDSNSRPQPWQGCALSTELFPQNSVLIYNYLMITFQDFLT